VLLRLFPAAIIAGWPTIIMEPWPIKDTKMTVPIRSLTFSSFSLEVECVMFFLASLIGESGSGKTESTNFLLHHLTALSHKGSHGSGVEQTILSAGPVLEVWPVVFIAAP
jgi:hypothetical protein